MLGDGPCPWYRVVMRGLAVPGWALQALCWEEAGAALTPSQTTDGPSPCLAKPLHHFLNHQLAFLDLR